MNVYVVKFVKQSNHSTNEAVFTKESLAKIYCGIKNKDSWIDKGTYKYEEVAVKDEDPELTEFILKGESYVEAES